MPITAMNKGLTQVLKNKKRAKKFILRTVFALFLYRSGTLLLVSFMLLIEETADNNQRFLEI